MRFVTIFAGSTPEVLARQCKLEAFGVQALVRDWNVKMVDPFITPGGLTCELQVPEAAVATALEILGHPGEDALRPASKNPATENPRDAEVEAELTALRKLGWTIVYGAVIVIFVPWSVWASIGYYRRVRELGRKPENYWLVPPALSIGMLAFVLTAARWIPPWHGP
jgi:hypothetical protein